MRCTAITQHAKRRNGHRCTRKCQEGTDFCHQHNPLNKLEDKTCPICLDDIKDPIKMGGCTHVFCKKCITESVMHENLTCPYCRAHVGENVVSKSIEVKFGKFAALKFSLDLEIRTFPWRWYSERPWTKGMTSRYLAVYPLHVQEKLFKNMILKIVCLMFTQVLD